MTDQSNAIPVESPARTHPLANRNFRLLWVGENVSLLGDQFYFVALPFLVFALTDSSLVLGALMMVAGIPRAVLMLLGGVLTDRFSPRTIMLASNLLRLGLTVLLTLMIAGQTVQLWMLFLMVFCFGVVDAFFYPAYRAMMPIIVDQKSLQASNALMIGATQLVNAIGPGLAGKLLDVVGMSLTFAFDSVTFLFSSVMLALMRVPALPSTNSSSQKRGPRGVLADIGAMLTYVRRDSMLPTILTVIASINLLFVGPLVIGSATLSKVRFVEGPAAYGWMLSAYSVGTVLGTLSAGALCTRRKPLLSLLGVMIQGLLMIGIAYSSSLLLTCGLWAMMGLFSGFGNVTVVTVTQRRVSKEMMGRFMSLVVLAEIGLTPISNGLAGMVADVNVTLLFVLAGILLMSAALLAISNPDIRSDEV